MSRSFKKHPRVKQEADKGMKRIANRKVRRHITELPKKGNSYKKLFESYYISDWNWIWTRKEAIQSWEKEEYDWIREEFKTLEEYLIYWEKCVKRK